MNARNILWFFFSFSGRETRDNFWPAMIVNFSVSAFLWVPVFVAFLEPTPCACYAEREISRLSYEQLWLVLPALLLLVVSKWALLSRRLHDIGVGLWVGILLELASVLLSFVPTILPYPSFIPLLVFCVLLCLPSKKSRDSCLTKDNS